MALYVRRAPNVNAFKITGIEPHGAVYCGWQGAKIHFDGDHDTIEVDNYFVRNYHPEVGNFYVVTSIGLASIMTAESFERLFTLVL
jgi:hypothetical protein